MNTNQYIEFYDEIDQKKEEYLVNNGVYPRFLVLKQENIDKLLHAMQMMNIPVRANPKSEDMYFKGTEILKSTTELEGLFLENPLN